MINAPRKVYPVNEIPVITLGCRMQISLRHAGLGAQEIADEIGVSRSTVSRWLNDHGAPPRNGWVKLWSQRTGVSLDWLQEGKQRPVPVSAVT